MRLLRWLMACPLVASPAFAQTIASPEVTVRFSNDRVLLGEPVWVVVTARNRSTAAVSWSPGDYGFDPRSDAAVPVKAIVPAPAPGSGLRERCPLGGGGGGTFWGASAADLAPGDSATWLFLFGGDFHFTHAGIYQVELTFQRGRPTMGGRRSAPSASAAAAAAPTLTLQVLPADDAALLARENAMAAKVDLGVFRPFGAARTKAQLDSANRQQENMGQIQKGLAMHPVAGMEPVFARWQTRGVDRWPILGLKSLNTAESGAALAELATNPNPRQPAMQGNAAIALGEMGNRQYYPVMLQLLSSQDVAIRREAILGVGYLGGDSAVATLVGIVHKGTDGEQGNAMMALGSTQSRAGVRALIDLIAAPDLTHPTDAEQWLFVLTHHRLESVTPRRTPAQTFEGWQQWWDAGGKDAPVYSPFECASG